jgi:sigma-B regulation protein RsbU (phosphoserine phosphatase)
MMVTSAKLSSRSLGVRTFFSRQLLLVMVAAALFAILWVANVRGPGMGFVSILLYSLFIGNLTTPIMNGLAPLSSRLRFPWNWVAFLIFLFLTAVAIASLVVVIIMAVYRIPIGSYFPQLWSAGRLVVVVVLVVGSIRHLHEESRVHLESKNLELQHAVETGNKRSQQQEQELAKAREIQEGLLPKKIPQVRGLEVAGAWQPASTVGGDYFDVLKFSERKIGVCIGDVVGKGISAALLMANLQASFRAFASEEVSPGTLVGKLNEVISSNIAADKFVTFCYCMIDTTNNRLTYASAGHCPPILFHKSGEAVPLKEGGTPLGIFPDRKYEDGGLQLESGDSLVLYTDGLTEAMNSDEQEFGEQRLVELGSRNIAMSASELLVAIRKEVGSFCSGNFQDDFTLVVVAVK